MTGSLDVTSKSDRLRLANGLLEEIRAIKWYVPSLTPDQKRWLEAERNSFDSIDGDALTSKLTAFAESSEFQLESLNGGLDEIIESLACVLDEKSTLARELLCWAYANWALTDSGRYNDAIHRLHSRRVIDFSPSIRKQFGLTYSDEDPWGGYHMFGRAIQKNVVLPLILMPDR